MKVIDAKGIYYKDLNNIIKEYIKNNDSIDEIQLENVNGQRYIGTGINKNVVIHIKGVPGNDLGAFMDGPTIKVYNNSQDGVANTMNSGKIVIHGDAGDVCGYGMRGGKFFVKGNVGYRFAIHAKEYLELKPKIVIGGSAGDFLGEYMAGGILILLGLNNVSKEATGNFLATGMHGGVIYIRGNISKDKLGKEVSIFETNENDNNIISQLVQEFCEEFTEFNLQEILNERFVKLIPISKRPYGKLYAPANYFPVNLEGIKTDYNMDYY